LERGEKWSDTGLSVGKLVLKEKKKFEKLGLRMSAIAITRFNGQKKALAFRKKIEKKGVSCFFTKEVKGYPYNMKNLFGPKGFKTQEYFITKRPIVVVIGAGANSGKMFACISQVYHDQKHGINAGFAKLETFPIWNLPIGHEVNVAYEAATADVGDYLMIDPFHKRAYGISAVNYNRDVENFAVLKKIIQKIASKKNFMHSYKSPTDMGMNMAKKGIINDESVREAARREIIRRYFAYKGKIACGEEKPKTLERMKKILKKAGLHIIE
jgi:uncharacterized protein (UPF0371 family)